MQAVQERAQDGARPSGITRVSKACDPCRIRKTRCDIATQSVCSECLKHDQAAACSIRDKARPKRSNPLKSKEPSMGEKRPRSPDGPRVAAKTVRLELNRSPSAAISISSRPPGSSTTLYSPGQVPGLTGTDWSTAISLPPGATFDSGPSNYVQLEERIPQSETVQIQSIPHPLTPRARLSTPSSSTWTSSEIRHTKLSGTETVESLIETIARERYGMTLSIALQPENVFTSSSSRCTLLEIGLIPGSPDTLKQVHHWIITHFRAIHHNTPFLSLPDILRTAGAVFGQPDPTRPSHDALAIMYAVLAVGSFREQTYDTEGKRYRSLQDMTGLAISPSTVTLALFNLSSEHLDLVERPSETAVQALYVLHTFVSNTSMSRRSRDYVARAVMMSHEMGLNRRLPADLSLPGRMKYDKHMARRRAMLYLYVYFSDVYLSALDNHPSLIKRQDHDPDVFDVLFQTSGSGIDTPSGTPMTGLRAFVDLVTTLGGVLEMLQLERGDVKVELILQLDSELEGLRERIGLQLVNLEYGDEAIKRTAAAGSTLRQIHYNWSRIALRAPFLQHNLLRHSSLSICARSATTILSLHRHVVSSALLNLPWMQLRRTATAIYIVYIAFWGSEITQAECETAIDNTLEVLCVFGTRWQSAIKVTEIITRLADKTGLTYRMPTHQPVVDQNEMLVQLAGLASSSYANVNTPSTFLPTAGLDLPSDTDLLAHFGLDATGLNVNLGGPEFDFLNWEGLDQPPW